MGTGPITKRQVPAPQARDNEEKRGSNLRRMLFRGHGRVTQPTNMRATAKQRGCGREKRQISARLPSWPTIRR